MSTSRSDTIKTNGRSSPVPRDSQGKTNVNKKTKAIRLPLKQVLYHRKKPVHNGTGSTKATLSKAAPSVKKIELRRTDPSEAVPGPKTTRGSSHTSFALATTNIPVNLVEHGLVVQPCFAAIIQIKGVMFEVCVDNMSPSTWIQGRMFPPSRRSEPPSRWIKVKYADGDVFEGAEHHETVSLGADTLLTIPSQAIGLGALSPDPNLLSDGVLALGPKELSRLMYRATETAEPDGSMGLMVTIRDNLVGHDKFDEDIVGLFFTPTSVEGAQLSFGGADETKILAGHRLTYTPLIKDHFHGAYVCFKQSVTYGPENIAIMPLSIGVVDSGQLQLELPEEAYNAYQQATGAELVTSGEDTFLVLTEDKYKNLKNLRFHINGAELVLTPDAQVWPRRYNEIDELDKNLYTLAVLKSSRNTEYKFSNGMMWSECRESTESTGN